MLRVFTGYTDNGLHPSAYRALTRYTPIGSLEMVNISGDISKYWQELRERWNGKHDLMTVEQDNVITSETIPSFNACNEPWCVFEYIGPMNMVSRGVPDRMLKTSLGCTRFSQQLQIDVPIEDISQKEYFVWYLIDYRIATVLTKLGYKPHVHGKIEHLHGYETSTSRIAKEDELYKESVIKAHNNPAAMTQTEGLEPEDALLGVLSKDSQPEKANGIKKEAESG